MRLGDIVKIIDLSEDVLRSQGRIMGVVLGFDIYNPPREMRESRSFSSRPLRGEPIVKVLWSGTETSGWVLQKRLEVIGMQND